MTTRMTIQANHDADWVAFIGDADDVDGQIVWAPKSQPDYIMVTEEASLAGLPAGLEIHFKMDRDVAIVLEASGYAGFEDDTVKWDVCLELLATLWPDYVPSFDRCQLAPASGQKGGEVVLLCDGDIGLPQIGYDAQESFGLLQTMWEEEVQRRLDDAGLGYVVAHCEIGRRAFDRASQLGLRNGATPSDHNWAAARRMDALIEGALEECAWYVDKWMVQCEVQVALPEDDDDANPLSVEFFQDVYRHGFSPMPDGGFLLSPLILYGEDAADFYLWCQAHRAWRGSPFGVPLLEFDTVCPPVMAVGDADVRKFPRVVWGHGW